MKFLLNFFFILQLPLGVLAQGGNLQFNRVLNFTSGANYTVPQGKVLKIENVLFDGSLSVNLNYSFCDTIYENGRYYTYCRYILANNYSAPLEIGSLKLLGSSGGNFDQGYHTEILSNYTNYLCNFCASNVSLSFLFQHNDNITCPIWLGEGEVVKILPSTIVYPSSGRRGFHISAIEFNIVP
jgi:hypothetical protein